MSRKPKPCPGNPETGRHTWQGSSPRRRPGLNQFGPITYVRPIIYRCINDGCRAVQR